MSDGLVSLTGSPAFQRTMRILRDTACSQSVMLSSVLPFSEQSACSYNTELRGVEMGCILRPVHCVNIESELVTGFFSVAISSELPIGGIDLLMGNDIAGGKVIPSLEVLDSPQRTDTCEVNSQKSDLYPACVITRSQALQCDDIALSDSVLMPVFSGEGELEKEWETATVSHGDGDAEPVCTGPQAPVPAGTLPVTRDGLYAAQRADPTLRRCFLKVVSSNKASGEKVTYTVDNGILMRK